MRKSHCSFYQNNGNGRCVAPCHWNDPTYKDPASDCTGASGSSMHSKYHHEQPVSMRFVDYRETNEGRREALNERMKNTYGI